MKAKTLRAALNGREDDHAIAVAGWLRAHRINFIHVPNEQSTTKEGRKTLEYRIMKQARMGVEKDFPDYLIFDPPPRMLSLWGAAFEIKRPGEKLRAGQKRWLKILQERYFAVPLNDSLEPVELAGIDAVIAQLEAWGYGNGSRRRG